VQAEEETRKRKREEPAIPSKSPRGTGPKGTPVPGVSAATSKKPKQAAAIPKAPIEDAGPTPKKPKRAPRTPKAPHGELGGSSKKSKQTEAAVEPLQSTGQSEKVWRSPSKAYNGVVCRDAHLEEQQWCRGGGG
jgi:hypothetical protein